MKVNIDTGCDTKNKQAKKFIEEKLIPFLKDGKFGIVSAHIKKGKFTHDEIKETDNVY